MLSISFLFLIVATSVITLSVCDVENNHYIHSIHHSIKERLHHLSRVIGTVPRLSRPCNDTNFIIITEIPFGNSGNNIIEFIHGLWLSKVYDFTFIVPPWIRPALHPFDLTAIHERFCFDYLDHLPPNSKTLDVTSEDSFFLFKLFFDPMYKSALPPFGKDVVLDMSVHFITIYAALWSSPSHHVINASSWLIEHRLGNSFNYTSIHKRSLEGGCNKVYSSQSQPSDFSPYQLNMNHPAWFGNLRNYHPICEMPASFALSTIELNNRTTSSPKYFIAYDGRGSIDDYVALNATFSYQLDGQAFPEITANGNARKFVDMFVSMNGDFFILNPYSTYSFQIYVIRVCFGLESVPIMFERDIYFKQARDYQSQQIWISWSSIHEAYQRIKATHLL